MKYFKLRLIALPQLLSKWINPIFWILFSSSLTFLIWN